MWSDLSDLPAQSSVSLERCLKERQRLESEDISSAVSGANCPTLLLMSLTRVSCAAERQVSEPNSFPCGHGEGVWKEDMESLPCPFFNLNLLQEAGAKLLSYWAWLKTKVLEHPSSKCWQAGCLERRFHSGAQPLLTSAASVWWPDLSCASLTSGSYTFKAFCVLLLPHLKKMRSCFKKSRKLYKMTLKQQQKTIWPSILQFFIYYFNYLKKISKIACPFISIFLLHCLFIFPLSLSNCYF